MEQYRAPGTSVTAASLPPLPVGLAELEKLLTSVPHSDILYQAKAEGLLRIGRCDLQKMCIFLFFHEFNFADDLGGLPNGGRKLHHGIA